MNPRTTAHQSTLATLQNLRRAHGVSRPRMAPLLAQQTGAHITSAIIRDLEEGRSAKWLSAYIDYATQNWGYLHTPVSAPVVAEITPGMRLEITIRILPPEASP